MTLHHALPEKDATALLWVRERPGESLGREGADPLLVGRPHAESPLHTHILKFILRRVF